MKILALPPLPAAVTEALRFLAQRGIETETLEGGEAPEFSSIVSSCDLFLLEATGREEWLTRLRDSPEAGALPIAAWGDETSGRIALEAGADLWLDAEESGALIALRLGALARRAVLGGAPRLDTLTGLIGHRWFGEILRHEFERSIRYRRSMGILVVEADPLEEINRNFGMEIGDRALRQMAEVLRGLVRDVDLLGRISGKRFAVILPETDAEGALTAGERLRAAVDGYLFPALQHGGSRSRGPLRLPISVGLAAVPSRGMAKATDLLGRAIESLLQAQRKGGNCVVAFGAPDIIWSREAPDPAAI